MSFLVEKAKILKSSKQSKLMHDESTPQDLHNTSIYLSLSLILKKLQSNNIHHHKIYIKMFTNLSF